MRYAFVLIAQIKCSRRNRWLRNKKRAWSARGANLSKLCKC